MKKYFKIIPTLFIAGSCLSFYALAQQTGYEATPKTLSAKQLLPENLLSGANFQIADEVVNDGLINTYTVKTDYGTFDFESEVMLIKRINELNALVQMEKLENSAIFTDALKNAGKSPFETVEQMIDDPSGTAKKVGTGISRWFGDVKRAVTSDDPHQPNALDTALGQAPVLRQFAFEFGVDPYTSFKPLQDELNELSWVAVSGGMTVKAAFSVIGGNVGSALSLSGTAGGLKELVRDKSPDELNALIESYLIKLDVAPSIANAFISNRFFNPQEKVLLVGELVNMEGVAERHVFLQTANSADSEEIALYMRVRAQLMGRYAIKQTVSKLLNLSGVPFMQYKDGTMVGILPLDYVLWTPIVENRAKEVKATLNEMGIDSAELHILGDISPSAKQALNQLGFEIKDQLQSQFGYK